MISGRKEPIILPCSAPIGILLSKLKNFRLYFNTFVLTRGFLAALSGSAYMYLDHFGFSLPWLNTLLGLVWLWLLLSSGRAVWASAGFFTGIFWFWWIALSFNHYHMPWAIPFVLLFIGTGYGLIFWTIAWIAEKFSSTLIEWVYPPKIQHQIRSVVGKPALPVLVLKALGLFILSYIHPFGFDWFKPELVFVASDLGIYKWQFALVLFAMVLSLWKRQLLFLSLILLAWQPLPDTAAALPKNIALATTHTSVEEKWDKTQHPSQFKAILTRIDRAIDNHKSLIILPESIFPLFLNYDRKCMAQLKRRAKKIAMVLGGLYWDGKTPRNSAYIFTRDGKIRIANKVLLVPFGEANPLPDFLSDWVNRIFYDGAIDYKADAHVTDYTIDGITYRNAICFEATSERLYEGKPKHMIVLSNNGWFTPSIEPTLQKLLLQYYSRKYGTTIYHAVNMSPSYVVVSGTAVMTAPAP